ncbi:MAG: hypothetical protein ONB33_13750 [candidate division KSB1 bacterium]|nr:hypothetical protein [candidate division KSB1 bacterium]MDZ7400755.1 hypothetical protein [candidate division KSB1 bacterium]
MIQNENFPISDQRISLSDYYDRLTNKTILATTAMYGPWLPNGSFDWKSYENLVREVIRFGSVPATNVDTTWAIYNDWELTKLMIWRTAEIALDMQNYLEPDRPLLVAGLNTNSLDITADQIASSLRNQIEEIYQGLKHLNFSRIRYMPVPDRRLFSIEPQKKIEIYREIGRVVGDYTDFGMVFFELDIGIPGFGSNFSPDEIVEILDRTPHIQEYKSAIISKKSGRNYPFDCSDDLIRIKIVEAVAPNRVQFSTGNDWFIGLARLGKNIERFGYLLGASQMSPRLFQQWRRGVEQNRIEAIGLEHDLQAAAKDFWTPGNVGIYRHYLAIFLAMTGLIAHPLPHPKCDERYRVKPADYFIPLRHAIRLGLIEPGEAFAIAKKFIPTVHHWSEQEIQQRIEWMG